MEYKIKTILLIKIHKYEGHYAQIVNFPLGLMSIASYVREKIPNININILDLRIEKKPSKILLEKLKFLKPDLIGISAITRESAFLDKCANFCRSHGFNCPIVAGGPGPTHFPEEILKNQNINYVVIGEGELPFSNLILALNEGKDISKIPGLAFRLNNKIYYSPKNTYINNIDSLPHPAWDLISFKKYQKYYNHSLISLKGNYINLFTSRGCPYDCIYCHSIFGKIFRPRTPELIIDEIKLIAKLHEINRIEILDDIFNWDLPRAKFLLDLLFEYNPNLELYFPNGLRCDKLDREFLEKLARFKFAFLAVPIETASKRIQKLINKNLNLDKITEVINICAELRIFTRGYFMLGFPSETEEELKQTIDYANKSKLHCAFFLRVIPNYGTKLYKLSEDILRKKQITPEDCEFFCSPLNLSLIPDKKFFRIYRWISFKFHFQLNRLYRLFRDHPYRRLLFTGMQARILVFLYGDRNTQKLHISNY